MAPALSQACLQPFCPTSGCDEQQFCSLVIKQFSSLYRCKLEAVRLPAAASALPKDSLQYLLWVLCALALGQSYLAWPGSWRKWILDLQDE